MAEIPPNVGNLASDVGGASYRQVVVFPLHTDGFAGLDDAADLAGTRNTDLKLVDGSDVAVAAAAYRRPTAGPLAAPKTGTAKDHHGPSWAHLVDGALTDSIVSDGDVEDAELAADSLGVPTELAGRPKHEVAYPRAARKERPLRGYSSDWADFTTWRRAHHTGPMPAGPTALTGYLVALAEAGATVGTLSRRLSSIELAHASAKNLDPATHPRVMAVWEGIRHVRGASPEQAAPLMPPLLFDVLAACPTTLARAPWAAPAPRPTATAGTPCGRVSSPTPTREAPVTERSLTKPGTARGHPWEDTREHPWPGPITPRHPWGYDSANALLIIT